METPRAFGILRKWVPERGFGFVKSTLTQRDYFLHINQVRIEDRDRLFCGHTLEFSPSETSRGLQAFEALIVDEEENC